MHARLKLQLCGQLAVRVASSRSSSAAGSAGSISTSQPSPYGSVLISSGASSSVVVAGRPPCR